MAAGAKPKKIFFSAFACAAVAAFCAGCGRGADHDVIVAGSTSVQPYAEILAEEFFHSRPDIIVDVQGGGSSAGITAAQTGTADIGMSSRQLNESESGLWSVEIAKDGLAVIVNPGNPVSGLTYEQVRGIYSQEITNWNEVGGADAKIHIIAREEGSGTRSAFSDLIMGGSRISPKAIVQDSNGAVRQLVSGDANSIGFISLGLVDDTVKALSLNGVEATLGNVLNGSYGLFRPFLFVAETEPTGNALLYVEYALSDSGRDLLAHEGLVTDESGGSR